MKRILKKILIVILIVLILNNFLISSVHAADVNVLTGNISYLFSGVIGILTYVYRAPAVIIGWLINKFMTVLAYSEGLTDPAATSTTASLTIFDVLFTKPKIIDIDFFNIIDGDTSLVNRFRTNVAAWFYIMRNISAGILLVILVYIGIRMSITTIASDKAMYKRMLVDWTVSLLLIFVLNYIIIFTIQINKVLVNSLAGVQSSNSQLGKAIGAFGKRGINPNPFVGISSLTAAIIYIILIWQTMALFFSYFNRMLKIAFLIIIAPLISLTYSIDKIGDGKAQALDAWLKEFVFTVLTQPFHCVIYLSLVDTALKLLIDRSSFSEISKALGAGVLAIVCILFTREAEKIVRKIFGFQDDNKSTSLVAGAAMASLAMNKAKNLGTGTVKAVQSGKDFVKNVKSLRLTNLKAEFRAARRYLSGGNITEDQNGEKREKDYAELQSEERAKAYGEQAEKWEQELKELGVSEKDVKDSSEIKKEAENLMLESNGKMTQEEAEAIARFNSAKEKVEKHSIEGLRKGKHGVKNALRTGKRAIKSTVTAPSKAIKFTRDKLNDFSEALPFSETRGLIAEEAKKAPGFVVGAGTLGLTGKVSGAVAAAVATNKVVEEFSDNTESTVNKDVEKLMKGHKGKDKEKTIREINDNPDRYAITDSKTSDHLKDIIKEVQSACKEFSQNSENLSETNIKNTIMKNTKDPVSAISSLLGVSAWNKENPSYGKALSAATKLQNYGVEYAVSQKLASAASIGIKPEEIVTNYSDPNSVRNVTERLVKKSGSKSIPMSVERSVKEIAEEDNGEQLTELYNKIEEEIQELRNQTPNTGNEESDKKLKAEYEKKALNLERKRTELVGKAVQEIKAKNEKAADELRHKILGDVESLLQKTEYTDKEKEELRELKKKLEKIKSENS